MVRNAVGTVGSCERNENFEYYMTCMLFAYMIRGHSLHWCSMLLENSIDSLPHLVTEIEILKLRKAPDESIEQFHTLFCNLTWRFPKDEIDCEFLDGRFKYLIYISENMQFLESFEPYSTYFSDGAPQSQVDTVAVTSVCLPFPHKIAPPLQSDAGEHEHTFVQLSHPPTLPALDIYEDLACKPIGFHVDLLPQPLSPCSVDPIDCIVVCSF